MHVAAFVTDAHQHIPHHLAVELQRPSQAVGNEQAGICKGVNVGRRTIDRRRAIGGIVGDRLRRIIREHRNVERNLVVEEPDTAANCGASIARGRKHESDARSDVHCLRRQAVVIQSQPEVEREPRNDLPVVLHEEREVVLRGLRSNRRAVADGAAGRAVLPQHRHRQVRHVFRYTTRTHRNSRPSADACRASSTGRQCSVCDH